MKRFLILAISILVLSISTYSKDKTTLVELINKAEKIPVYIQLDHIGVEKIEDNKEKPIMRASEKEKNSASRVDLELSSDFMVLQDYVVKELNAAYNTDKFVSYPPEKNVMINEAGFKVTDWGKMEYDLVFFFRLCGDYVYRGIDHKLERVEINNKKVLWSTYRLNLISIAGFFKLDKEKEELERVSNYTANALSKPIDVYGVYNDANKMAKDCYQPKEIIPLAEEELSNRITKVTEKEQNKYEKKKK